MNEEKNNDEGVEPLFQPDWLEGFVEEENIIGKLSLEEYNSVIENYKDNNNLEFSHTLRWLENFIKRNTKKKYIKKKKVEKMIRKISEDLGIKYNYPIKGRF